MAKLFPPHIEGKLPAFALDDKTLTVPFTMNRAVAASEISLTMRAIIKTVQTNKIIVDGIKGSFTVINDSIYQASFDISNIINELKVGQFYKIQIAYVDNGGEIGYYSSVGIIKCTTNPKVYIEGLEQGSTFNKANNNFVGKCSWIKDKNNPQAIDPDKTEKVYSYCFTLSDENNTVIATTGEQLHNSSNDTTSFESSDTWFINLNLEDDKVYYIDYQIKTINGLVKNTTKYMIVNRGTIDPNLPCELIAIQNQDEGQVSLYLRPTEERSISGSFILSRTSSKDDYKTWDEIYRFVYKNYFISPRSNTLNPSLWDVKDILIWEDYTTEQGVDYIYSLQAYNNKEFYSNRVLNKTEELIEKDENGIYYTHFVETPVKIDFEDAFLFDGKRQLKIKFNPKVSSFKNTILESKVDTIGSKYPFIFKNGNVNYKEFPISGLISLIGDAEEKFFKGIQNNHSDVKRSDKVSAFKVYDADTQLTRDNFRRERDFKMEVLDWLTNGEPKLFRSPAEGNFIVRLMNTSLTPTDTVGRMIHSFQCTAYEIADCTFNNLIDLGLISKKPVESRYLRVGQIRLAEQGEFIALNSCTYMAISDATPGTLIEITIGNNKTISIEINGTGNYILSFDEPIAVSIKLNENQSWNHALLNYNYYDDSPTDNFSFITNITSKNEIRQVIGANFENNILEMASTNNTETILRNLSDVKRKIDKIYILKVRQRPIFKCQLKEDGLHWQYDENKSIGPINQLDVGIYEIEDNNETKYYYGKSKTFVSDKPDYRFQVNNQPIIDMGGNLTPNISTYSRIEILDEIDKVESLYIGSGVSIDIYYRVKEIEYDFEDTDTNLIQFKNYYQESLSNLADSKTIEKAYQDYIYFLEQDLEEQGVDSYEL